MRKEDESDYELRLTDRSQLLAMLGIGHKGIEHLQGPRRTEPPSTGAASQLAT